MLTRRDGKHIQEKGYGKSSGLVFVRSSGVWQSRKTFPPKTIIIKMRALMRRNTFYAEAGWGFREIRLFAFRKQASMSLVSGRIARSFNRVS